MSSSSTFSLWTLWHDRVAQEFEVSPAWAQLRRRRGDVVPIMGWVEANASGKGSFSLDVDVLSSIEDEIGATREEVEGAFSALLRCGLIREVERNENGIILRVITPKEDAEEIAPAAVQEFFAFLHRRKEAA